MDLFAYSFRLDRINLKSRKKINYIRIVSLNLLDILVVGYDKHDKL